MIYEMKRQRLYPMPSPTNMASTPLHMKAPEFGIVSQMQSGLEETIANSDSGYMLRDWLLTPILNPHTPKEQAYIDALCVTRCTVERCIGVLKRRWHCLHGEIRLATRRVCKVITACVVLHNRARSLRLAPPEGEEAAPAQSRPQFNPPPRAPVDATERVRTAAGKALRDSIVQNYF